MWIFCHGITLKCQMSRSVTWWSEISWCQSITLNKSCSSAPSNHMEIMLAWRHFLNSIPMYWLTQGLPHVHKYTIFHSNDIPEARSWEITENEWTCWLAYCLPKYLPCDYLSSYSGNDGPQFDDLQWSYSSIKLSDMYILELLTSF